MVWRAHILLVLGLATSAAGAVAQAAAPGPFRISLEPSYFAGRFGTAHGFRIYDLPLAIIYRKDRLRVRVEIPYVAVAGAGLLSGGTVLRGGRGTALRSGVGDVWVSAQYRVVTAQSWRPAIKPLIKIKIPLASRTRGLGTGQVDAELGSRFDWRIGTRIFPYAEIGYRINGRTHGLRLRNAVTYQLGTSIALAHEQYVTAVFIGHSAFQYRVGPTDSIVAAYNITLNPIWGLEAYVDRGLTANSPSVGLGFGVTAGF
ncbi:MULTISPECIES: hypothetical protein [Acidiphilium]|uniref:MetA-pathway of phenol degradation n=1 Tax=Acidiphilium rubrum TaxID=526 RepID=A0A8G2CNS1_ACIRU|nr:MULTISPECIES: hypothetical protein [Acidiphilium]SIR49127.1 hypothetical protein SAMN05421828_13912 [Acidiphilium rubrum]